MTCDFNWTIQIVIVDHLIAIPEQLVAIAVIHFNFILLEVIPNLQTTQPTAVLLIVPQLSQIYDVISLLKFTVNCQQLS